MLLMFHNIVHFVVLHLAVHQFADVRVRLPVSRIRGRRALFTEATRVRPGRAQALFRLSPSPSQLVL